jgi:hypothetical protein
MIFFLSSARLKKSARIIKSHAGKTFTAVVKLYCLLGQNSHQKREFIFVKLKKTTFAHAKFGVGC